MWVRLDDTFPTWPEWDEQPAEIPWGYIALAAAVCRDGYYAGVLPTRKATAVLALHTDDPAAVLAALEAVGLVQRSEGHVRLTRAAEHVPPQPVRDKTAAAAERKRRNRAHRAGDHSLCLPDNCPDAVTRNVTPGVTPASRPDVTAKPSESVQVGDLSDAQRAPDVTPDVTPASRNPSRGMSRDPSRRVTRDTGSGRDGTGQAFLEGERHNETGSGVTQDGWPAETCEVCGRGLAELRQRAGYSTCRPCELAKENGAGTRQEINR